MTNQQHDDDHLLASDADREQALARLRDACVDGRLTLEEFSARTESALTARTRAQLRALTADLAETPAVPALPSMPARVYAVLSETKRGGHWRAEGGVDVVAFMGNCTLDLRGAELAGGQLVINIRALMSNVQIYVPRGVNVAMEDASILSSSKDTRGGGPSPAHGPTVRLRGLAVLSSIEVLDQESRGFLGLPHAR
jgi:hypothetical protein